MKHFFATVLCLGLAVLQLFSIPVSAYTNPMILEHEWPGYSIGDPFILKHNGSYYLYVSTKDGQTGVKCWQSDNLVDWTYAGLCSTDPITTTAYAPEVLYYNGYFYMYTSPSGNGHYVLRSDSPTGPFEVVTGNWGKSIDGSAFVDDDGTIYFLHAAHGQLSGCILSTPSQIQANSDFSIPVSVNGAWTEGPTLFRRNGFYYLTYTGNHVIHDSYRVEYAVSTSPTSGFTEPEQNVLLLSTDGATKGLGHNSIVIGPDLDTYYIVYHSLESPNGPFRHLNLDRILWNGDKLCIQANGGVEMENPALPDYEERFSEDDGWKRIDGLWLSGSATESVYTAEYNWQLDRRNGAFSVYFSYVDENNYGKLTLSADERTLLLGIVKDGVTELSETTSIMRTFSYDKLHTFTVRQTADTLTVQLDQQQKFSVALAGRAGQTGYDSGSAALSVSYTAFSNKAMGSQDHATVKNFPSTMEAVHANQTSEGAFTVAANVGANRMSNTYSDNSRAYRLGTGGWLEFEMLIGEAGTYSLALQGAILEGDTASLRLILDDTIMWDNISVTPQAEEGYSTWVIRGLELPAGKHTLRLQVKEGALEAYTLTGSVAQNQETATQEIQGDITAQDWIWYDEGSVLTRGDTLVFSTTGSFAKVLQGNKAWTDYTAETTMLLRNGTSAGLLLRAQNAIDGLADHLGIHATFYHQGYFVALEEGAVKLYKHNYNSVLLYAQEFDVKTGQEYTLTASVVGATITVWLDGQEIFTYTDREQPFLTGMAGLKTDMATAYFYSFSVAPVVESALTATAQDYDHAVIGEQPAPREPDPDGNGETDNRVWLYVALAAGAALVIGGCVGFGYWWFRRRAKMEKKS